MTDATSIRQLAKAVGRSEGAVRKWLDRRDFPVQREAPWSSDDVEELKLWMRTLQPNRAEKGRAGTHGVEPVPDEQTKDYWLMRKYRAQALEQEGQLLDAETVKQEWVKTLATIRQRVLLVGSSVRTLCDHKPGDEVERVVDEQLRTALDDVADRLGDLSDSAIDSASGGEGATDAPAPEAE